MDPISQGVLGASAAQSATTPSPSLKPKYLWVVTVLGWLGGMAADLDVLIKSKEDPLLFLKFHRHFTHSLFFIPFGGLFVSGLLHIWARRHMSFLKTYLFVTVGYATHGLLDACTTYGTQLFWPFSDTRVAWNSVSIIDPLFTLPMILLSGWAVVRNRLALGRAALIWGLCYLLFGVVQRDRAERFAAQVFASSGVTYTHLSAKASFGNLFLWKIVTRTQDEYHVDAVHVGLDPIFIKGDRVQKLVIERDFPNLPLDSVQARDIERFRWFSDDYLALSKTDPNVIIDMRYSMLPHRATGLWGIRIDRSRPHTHVQFESFRDTSRATIQQFFEMLFQPFLFRSESS